MNSTTIVPLIVTIVLELVGLQLKYLSEIAIVYSSLTARIIEGS